ncbi:hypothetical protein [Limnochorda pilosa]|uniref:Uncharacterized protein n=1 Tax=Limnochorda pilosa TaxID=1555112 RepID=A0A0K2SNR6_LIMPI|nr:hypothetical protein [Limnochorda pilosa]BAS28778.1 hypothetical protein LIP_2949 [Limnochorda pilosa]
MGEMGDPPAGSRVDPDELEQAIARVRGALSARVVFTPGGDAVEEIHVLAHTGRTPKQIVRDVVSLCQAQFGLEIDHRVVSVAQVEAEEAPAGGPDEEPRLQIDSILVENRQKTIRVRVQLQQGEALYEGESEGSAQGANGIRLGAEAVIRAIQEFMEGLCRITLEDVLAVEMGDAEAVVAAVQLSVRGRMPESLVGSALVQSDPVEAAVRAVLDALNRKLILFNLEEELV